VSASFANPKLTLPRLCRWALGYALRRPGALAVVAFSLLLKVGFDVLKPWPMVFLLDYVLGKKPMPSALAAFFKNIPGSHDPLSLVGWTVAATIAVFLGSWAVGLAAAYGNINLGQRMTYDLAGDLFAKLQQLSLHFHTRKSVGDSIRRVTADCTCASTVVKDALLPVLSSAISLVLMFGILLRIDVTLTWLSIAVVPYMIWVFRRYAVPMMEQSYQQQEAEGKLYEVVEQTFAAMPVVQAFCREEFNDRWFARTTGQAWASTLSLTTVQLRFKILMGLATALGTAAVLWFGAQHALAGSLSIGAIILFLSYLGSLYAPLEAIMYGSSTIQGAAGSARRVWEILQTPTRVADKPSATPLRLVQGKVRLENVTFGYDPGRPVLQDISLEVPAGQTLALVGATGAGKSTLVSLLPRFFDPSQGRVLVDDVDVRNVTLRSLRGSVALVLQEPFLFPISIAENIAYGCPQASLEQIEEAAKAANAHQFITRLPRGYETVIGERGATLSGGERQRLSIARALLKNAPILILDEPTSSLDAQTEQSLMQAIERLTAGRTTFIIAHRLSTVRRAHRIIVLKEGRVIESGTHSQLLQQAGEYANFYHLQAGGHQPAIEEST